jgi:hypothetical protein
VRPNGPDRALVALFALFRHGVNTVARRIGCLTHDVSFRLKRKLHHCGFVGENGPRA